MSLDIVMPKLGESVTEGTVVRWLKQEGDEVARDEPILEISTDKIDTDIPCITDGVLKKILVQEGETVEVGQVLGILEVGGNDEGDTTPEIETEVDPVSAVGTSGVPVAAARPSDGTDDAPTRASRDQFYSPLVRSIARREGISVEELDGLDGSGRNGRVTKKDILAYVGQRTAAPAAPAITRPVSSALTYTSVEADVMVMDNVRKAIAGHMVHSKATSPHVTSFTEVDMTHISRYREQVKDDFLKKEGFKLTLTPFFIAAIVDALRTNPMLNASVDGDKIVLWKHVNFGLAVGLEKGVVVPVIQHAEEKNFLGLAGSAYDLAVRAHDRKLNPDELQRGTFTLTNPGMWGTMFGTPIISQPQIGIIATGAVKKQMVVRDDDTIAIRSIMYMSLSYDHRVVDGLNAARFTQNITKNLEQFDLSEVGV